MLLCSDQGLLGKLCGSIGNSGGDTGEMEPVCILENIIEIKICLGCGGNGRMCPVVNNLGRSHGRAALEIVDTKSLTTFCDVLGAYIVLSEGCNRALTNLVVGNCSHELSVMTIVCKRYGHVCLTAAVVDVKLVCLNEFLEIGGGKSQHNLTHCNHFCHF